MKAYFIFFFLILFPFLIAIKGKNKKIDAKRRLLYYSKDILISLLLLCIIYLLDNHMYNPPDFSKLKKGILISNDWISTLTPIFFIPFITSIFSSYSFKNSETNVFGLPIKLMPANIREFVLFSLFIVIGVIFEELLCRQFMFYSFNRVLGLEGDILLLVTSFLFAIGHSHQGLKGVLASFIIGLLLGKIYQMKENIMYPIALHLFMNLTLMVIAFKMIRLRKAEDDVMRT